MNKPRGPKLPKKLRGDAASAARYRKIAAEASAAALAGDSHNKTLLRVIATLVEQLGGEVKLPFRHVAGAPDLAMTIENRGTPTAMVILAVGERRGGTAILAGDRVVVHTWDEDPSASKPTETDVAWPGKVTALEGELLIVTLDQPHLLERVVVQKSWTVLEADAAPVPDPEASTRVDT